MDLNVEEMGLLAVGALLAFLAWGVAEPFWSYIALGLLVAAVSYPLQTRIEDRLGHPRVAAGLTVTVAVGLAVAPLALVAMRIVEDLGSLVGALSTQNVVQEVHRVMAWSHATFGYPEQVDTGAARDIVEEVTPSVRAQLANWIPVAISSAADLLLGLVVTVAVAYYALLDGEAAIDRLREASPMRGGVEEKLLDEAKDTVDGVVWGLILTAVVQGGLGFVAFSATGIPSPFFWSFAMAVLSFIQVVGALAIWGPAAIYLLASGQTLAGIGLLLWGILVISSVDNVVKPMAIGRSSALHPLLAFVGVLGGLAGFGLMGFLLGPLVLSLLVVVLRAFAQEDWADEAAAADG